MQRPLSSITPKEMEQLASYIDPNIGWSWRPIDDDEFKGLIGHLIENGLMVCNFNKMNKTHRLFIYENLIEYKIYYPTAYHSKFHEEQIHLNSRKDIRDFLYNSFGITTSPNPNFQITHFT